MAHLDDWNFVDDVWHGMWPPNHQRWNLDESYPIRSHRSGIGSILVVLKRAQRAVISLLARPLLVRQAEINRNLALTVRMLVDEVARERIRIRAREQRLARVGAMVRELRGDAEPLVRFED